jgi:hypothetical protein
MTVSCYVNQPMLGYINMYYVQCAVQALHVCEGTRKVSAKLPRSLSSAVCSVKTTMFPLPSTPTRKDTRMGRKTRQKQDKKRGADSKTRKRATDKPPRHPLSARRNC